MHLFLAIMEMAFSLLLSNIKLYTTKIKYLYLGVLGGLEVKGVAILCADLHPLGIPET